MSDIDHCEENAFKEAMRHVKPLKDKYKRAMPPHHKSELGPVKSTPKLSSESLNFTLSDPPNPKSKHSTISTLFYSRHSLRTTQHRALKRGNLPLATTLDLHGFTLKQARPAVIEFMNKAYYQKQHAVLIIHGKGYRSQASRPVLKHYLNHWLRQFPWVLAFCSAQPKHGGTGAVYVLLKSR